MVVRPAPAAIPAALVCFNGILNENLPLPSAHLAQSEQVMGHHDSPNHSHNASPFRPVRSADRYNPPARKQLPAWRNCNMPGLKHSIGNPLKGDNSTKPATSTARSSSQSAALYLPEKSGQQRGGWHIADNPLAPHAGDDFPASRIRAQEPVKAGTLPILPMNTKTRKRRMSGEGNNPQLKQAPVPRRFSFRHPCSHGCYGQADPQHS